VGITRHKITQKTPHAAMLVWNYKNRLGSEFTNTPAIANETEKVIISTISLSGIQTQKTKSNPVGNFTVTLAPTKNWNNTLTEGSWMALLMSQKKIVEADFDKVDSDKLKFFGRIESIRANITVDGNGARKTVYTITGTDWGSIFNNIIYIDPLAQTQGGISNATALNFATMIPNPDNPGGAFTSREMLLKLIELWGQPLDFKEFEEATNLIINPNSSFVLPKDVISYFNFVKDDKVVKRTGITDILDLKTGKLASEVDTLKKDRYIKLDESNGYINITDLLGQHTVWQVLQGHSCPTLNEMFCDLRFDKGVPSLTLYNRIKPFFIKESEVLSDTGTRFTKPNLSSKDNPGKAEPALAEPYISKFVNIRRFDIPTEEILNFEAGTNWRDKFNFVEIRSGMNDNTLVGSGGDHIIKQNSQLADFNAFQREGFRPYIAMTKQIPLRAPDEKSTKIATVTEGLKRLTAWKFLLREWYFDTHRLLNGTISFTGQNDYIQIGDNIMVNADVLSPSDNYNVAHKKLKDEAFILLHVESISHKFTINALGARNWITTVQFVRGIIVNAQGKIKGETRTDKDAGSLGPADDKNKTNVFGTSTEADPDPQKLKGN